MAKDYSRLSKEELLKAIDKLETRKKYGLIWDEERTKEKFENEAQNALPVLKEIKSKEIRADPTKPLNILIEGDNYHALSVLNYTHQGKIDIIYIDPPYNTGAKDWKYNNAYVDKNDTYRHSKWLSFMKKRLRLAKNLLKPRGVLICTVDENEHASLGLLLPELFPNKEIVCVTIIHNPGGIQGLNFSYCHEYAYFIHPRLGTHISHVSRDDIDPVPLRDWGKETSKRESARSCFYAIYIKDNKIVGFGDVCPDDFHPSGSNVKKKDLIEIYPVDKKGIERKWRFSRKSIEGIKDELFCKELNKELVVYRAKTDYRWKTVWTDGKYNANVYGTQLLNKIISTKFPFPKSLYAVQDCINAVIHDKDNAIILDFFAGSGTTGHAVLDLNRLDNGKRQFILCTNDEGNICTDVCYPRLSRVITGYKEIKGKNISGLGGNLKYFKTSFVKRTIGLDSLKIRITAECTEMLCLREGIFDEVRKTENYRIFRQNDRIMGIFYSLERGELKSLKRDFEKMKGRKILYCFTLDPFGLDNKEFQDWRNVRLEPVPQPILDIYEGIHEY